MDNDDRVARHVRITGGVQGVWYRQWTVREARRRGLDGWVRNRSDGSVEAVFAGPASSVAGLIHDCAEGPPGARVEQVVESQTAEPGAIGFEQRPTV